MSRAVWCMGLLLCASSAWAGRPLTIDDAEPQGKGQFKLEAGVEYRDQEDRDNWNFPASFAYGLVENLEIGVGFGGRIERSDELGQTRSETRFSDVAMGAKWRYTTQEKLLADQSLVLGILWPTRSESANEYGVTWIATRQISKPLAMDVNLGYTAVAANDTPDFVHYGVAVRYAWTQALEPVAEIFADTPTSGDEGSVVAVNAGIRWSVAEPLTLDASVGAGLTEEAPDVFLRAGLTWVF